MEDLIYVSDSNRHLVCLPYSIDNLHRMAKDLKIGRHFYHKGKHPHYDIPARREDEVVARTVQTTSRIILSIISDGPGGRLWPEGRFHLAGGQITLRRPLRIVVLPPQIPKKRKVLIDLS